MESSSSRTLTVIIEEEVEKFTWLKNVMGNHTIISHFLHKFGGSQHDAGDIEGQARA